MGRQTNNRQVFPSCFLGFSNEASRLQTIHARHLNIHQDKINAPLFNQRQGLAAIGSKADSPPPLFQESSGEQLINAVVFDQKDASWNRSTILRVDSRHLPVDTDLVRLKVFDDGIEEF